MSYILSFVQRVQDPVRIVHLEQTSIQKTTSQVLNSHMWPMATVLDSTF